MKVANIAEFENGFSRFLAAVEHGEEGEIRNRTQLGCGRGTAKILGDLTEPLLPESDWKMPRDG